MPNSEHADMQRWSEEVARDPGSLAFLPLARAYRRGGQREAALRLCLRALTRHPTHVEGHGLLALLYLESGDHEKASDEWATVLRLDPENFEAHRGLGFFRLERRELDDAKRHLERAAESRPNDPAVRDALSLLRQQLGINGASTALPEAAPPPRDPGHLFESLLEEPCFLGALVLDSQGLVLAGTLRDGGADRTTALGAVLGGAIEEATRTVAHLELGEWRGILLETETAVLHIAPLAEELVLLVAASSEAPTAWTLRTATRASELARSFLGSAP